VTSLVERVVVGGDACSSCRCKWYDHLWHLGDPSATEHHIKAQAGA
jgi:hypothetical protein